MTLRALGLAALAGLLILHAESGVWLGPPARAEEVQGQAAASESFRILGAVERPMAYGLRDLQAKPRTTLRVYYNTGRGPVNATYDGVLLWSLLEEAGIRTNPAVPNELLRLTVRLTASDGYEVVLGLGEIAPAYGGEQAIIAFEQDGAPLPPKEGFARLLMPGDKAGGRNLFAISRIEVR